MGPSPNDPQNPNQGFGLPTLSSSQLSGGSMPSAENADVGAIDNPLPKIEGPKSRRLAPSDYKVWDKPDDNASFWTTMLTEMTDDPKKKIALYAAARNESGFFGDESIDDSINRYFVDHNGRIAYKHDAGDRGYYRYEEGTGFLTWLKKFGGSMIAETPTMVGEAAIESTAGRFSPILKVLGFLGSHIGQESAHRSITGEPIMSGDAALDVGENMTWGLLGLGPSMGKKYLFGDGDLGSTQFQGVDQGLSNQIKDNQQFFQDETSLNLPLDQASDRQNKGLMNLGSWLRNQPESAEQFDKLDMEIGAALDQKAGDTLDSIGGSGRDSYLLGTDLVQGAKAHKSRLQKDRATAVQKNYDEAYQETLNKDDVSSIVFELEAIVKNIASPHAKPLKTVLNDLQVTRTVKGENGVERVEMDVIDSVEKLHSIRQYLDDEIEKGGRGIHHWVNARQKIDAVLKQVKGMADADKTYADYTDMIMKEMGVYFERIAKLPDNTNLERLAENFLTSSVTSKSVIEQTRKIMQSNPEYRGLWEDLVALKFGMALDKAFKNDTAESAGMNVWKNLSNTLSANSPLGKNLRIALNDDADKLANFENFVRLARLAGNNSGRPSQTQIFTAIEKSLRDKAGVGVHMLTGVGQILDLFKRTGATINQEAYRQLLKGLAGAFMSSRGIDRYNEMTTSFARAIEGSLVFPTGSGLTNVVEAGVSAADDEANTTDRMTIQPESYGLQQSPSN